MKIKKLITATTCAALIAATALPLSACGGAKNFKNAKEGELDITKYAQELPDWLDGSRDAVSKATEVASGFSDVDQNGNFLIAVKGTDPASVTKSVYNAMNAKLVVGDVESSATITPNGSFVTVSKIDGAGTPYQTVYGEDGTLLIGECVPSSHQETQFTGYIDGKEKDLLKVTGKKTEGDVTYYYEIVTDDDGNQSYTSVPDSSKIKYVSSDLSAGNDKFAVARPIYGDPEKPVEGEIASYKYSSIANELVFSKDGEETGRINTDNLVTSAFVGDYMYYTVMTELPDGDKDANLIIPTGSKEMRYNYEFHKYNIVKDKDSKLNYSYGVDEIVPLYNSEKKSFDAAVIGGSKIVNHTRQLNAPFAYVVTSELGVAYDVTPIAEDLREDFQDYFFKLDEEKYVYISKEIMNDHVSPPEVQKPSYAFVLNNKLEPVATFVADSMRIMYSNEKLVQFAVDVDEHTQVAGLVDYNGKIVASPEYMSIGAFYGGKALAIKSDGTSVVLSADGSETAIPEPFEDDKKKVGVVTTYLGWYVVSTETNNDDGSKSNKIEAFTYGGSLIKTIENGNEVMPVFDGSYNVKSNVVMEFKADSSTWAISIIE